MIEGSPPLWLRPVSRLEIDAPVAPLRLDPGASYTVGRSSEADWPILEPSVSRRHAALAFNEGRWFLTDLDSRHGTSVNGQRLAAGKAVPIVVGDQIGFGSWLCRCHAGAARPGATTPFVEVARRQESISAIDTSNLSGVAQRGLEALLVLAGRLDTAASHGDVAEAVVAAVAGATGCRRVVVARIASESELELLASTTEEPPRLSRSLIDAAERNGLVELSVASVPAEQTHSIMELRIRSAICAPIHVGGAAAAFLVLDTRDAETSLPPDAAAFCQSVARLSGLALARIEAAMLAERHRQLEQDLAAARRAQELLSPPRDGSFGRVRWVYESLAGRIVAGDLFDVFPLRDDRIAFFLGDVCGKGVGAALLMATTQSQLRTQLLSGRALPEAVAAVSADLHARTEASKFVTLIAGIVDLEAETLTLVDAGHGLCVVTRPGTAPERLSVPNGFPLGIVEAAEYESCTVPFGSGASIVVFSDGAIEQPCPAGRQFGADAVLRTITEGGPPEGIVRVLTDAVRRHAAAELADDLTVAAISRG